jgi:hypothetical protein
MQKHLTKPIPIHDKILSKIGVEKGTSLTMIK